MKITFSLFETPKIQGGNIQKGGIYRGNRTDSPEPREVFECNFNVQESPQNFFHAPQNISSCSLKYNFLHVISAELL